MGCAGLSLAVQLSASGLTSGKKILLIDREKKNANNRTWCFWETSAGYFEDIVYRSWDKAWFYSKDISKLLQLQPYRYKMIRGIDFYDHCMELIARDPAFELSFEDVRSIYNEETYAVCEAGGNKYTAPILFNSILFEKPELRHGEYFLLQHFKGWVIRTPHPAFTPDQATLMDFRPHQENGTTFIYVMPFSANEALIEYTLFSPALLSGEAYTKGLSTYLNETLGLEKWEVVEEEFGVIPMTNYRFKRRDGCILNIGTAGGMTKASSGYTFRFIQKDTQEIVAAMLENGNPFVRNSSSGRFRWYDSVLLNILSHGSLKGDHIFAELFQHNAAEKILKFLDNETSVTEELRILSSLPQWPFMKAGLSEGLKRLTVV
jgi:lycopene beta-cyclase